MLLISCYKEPKNESHKFFRLYSFVMLLVEFSNGFNIAPEAYYIASFDPESAHRSPYFGYSVGILKTETKSWLLVGAPRANSTIPQIIEPGSLFKCDVTNKNRKCEEVVLDGAMNGYKDTKLGATPLRDYAWTGAALDIDKEGNVIIGAPRWSDIPINYKTEYNTNGLCYVVGPDLTSGTAEKLPVLIRTEKQLYKYGNGYVYYYQHGEIGMSVHLTNTSNQQLLLGAPGVLNWQGSVAQLEPLSGLATGGINRRQSSRHYDSNSAIVLNPILTSKIQDSFYFGYSLTSGKFDLEMDYYIVAGAPRGASSYGMVFVFLMKNNVWGKQRFYVKEERSGSQLGEYFGASVAAPDLNGDGLSDLVVGAPMHSLQGMGDAGCVYVYINGVKEKGKLAVNAIKLLGNPVKRARYGTALGTPGDLNKDGFEDLLVGAPYEYDTGAVYVYMGFRNGIRETFTQKLTPKTLSANTPQKGFGVSFSRPVDIDDNQYPDFAIGSFLSDSATIMLTRKVIKVHGKISANPSKLSIAHSYFITTSCLSYSGHGAPPSADISVTVTLTQQTEDGRILATFRKNGNTEIQIHLKTFVGINPTCEELPVDLIGDWSSTPMPISVHLTYDLISKNQTGPVLDPHAVFPEPITLSFIKGCKNDPECHADLVISAHLKDFQFDEHLLIGNTSKITLEVEVANLKDPAFTPNITISFPSSLKIYPSGHICSSLHGKNWRTTVICHLKSPLFNTKAENLILEFDVSSLDDSSSDVVIDLQANSAADLDENPANNNLSVYLKVKKKAKLEFRGSSNPEQHSYHHFDEHTIISDESVKLQSIIVISKLDVTPLGAVNITVNFPSDFDLDGDRVSLLQNFGNELLFHGKFYNCEENDQQLDLSEKSNLLPGVAPRSQSETRRHSASGAKLSKLSCSSKLFYCKSVVCRIGPWSKSFDVATLTVSYELNLTTLSHLIYVKDGAIIETEIFAEISSLKGSKEQFEGVREIKGSIQTILIAGTLPPEPLAWWIYFLAILGGFILLALIAYGLFKIGFFKRKKKLQLEAQKATLLHKENEQQEIED